MEQNFRRFAHLSAAKTGAPAGTGLGLANLPDSIGVNAGAQRFIGGYREIDAGVLGDHLDVLRELVDERGGVEQAAVERDFPGFGPGEKEEVFDQAIEVVNLLDRVLQRAPVGRVEPRRAAHPLCRWTCRAARCRRAAVTLRIQFLNAGDATSGRRSGGAHPHCPELRSVLPAISGWKAAKATLLHAVAIGAYL